MRIAYVDDDELSLTAHKLVLGAKGFDVLTYKSSDEFRILSPRSLDVIISDGHLTNEDYRAIAEVREARFPFTPFIVYSSDIGLLKEARKLGYRTVEKALNVDGLVYLLNAYRVD